MNKQYWAFTFALFMTACTALETDRMQVDKPHVSQMRFVARVENASLKTTLDGTSVKWDPADEISIFDGLGNRRFTIERIEENGNAVFVGEAVPGQPLYYACYPYNESNTCDEGVITASFPRDQSASKPGSFENNTNLSVAVLKDGAFVFKNVGGLMRFTLLRGNVSRIQLFANDEGFVSGACATTISEGGDIVSSQMCSGSTSLRLTPSSGETFLAGEYFLCLPAKTYSGGVKLLLDTSEGEQIQAGTSADVIVERAKITGLGTIDTNADKAHRTLVFTPIESLNPEGAVNSHAGWTQYSSLMPIAGTEVILDDATLGSGPNYQYPRFVKLPNGEVLLFYHPSGNGVSQAGNRSNYLRSSNLVDWTFESNLFKPYSMTDYLGNKNTRAYAGGHPLILPNGTVLAVAATRVLSNYKDRIPDNGLSIRLSTDNGRTWGAEQLLLVGTVWEPFPVVLSSGRIQVYYTDFNAETGGTGTSFVYSDDNGLTWAPGASEDHLRAFAQVWYRDEEGTPVLTDQMPAVVQLKGTERLVGVCESKVGSASAYSYRLSRAVSDIDGSWGTPDSDGVLPTTRENHFCVGAAPYLVQFPSGETVLTYNASGFLFRMGDHLASNFAEAGQLFPGKDFCWGSTCLLGSHRLIAGVGGGDDENDVGCLKIGQFYLNHAITPTSKTVAVDSRTGDWNQTDEALWLCSGGASRATIRSAADAQYLYFLSEVEDEDLSVSDYMEITLTTLGGESPFMVKANFRGLVTASTDAVVVRSAYDGTANSGDADHGYLLEISIPLQQLPVQSGCLLLTCSLIDSGNTDVSEVTVPLLGMKDSGVSGVAGNNSETGAYWTYESDDYVW